MVRVALPVPIDSLFSYAVPESLVDRALPGCRVLVPFSGRKLTGLIVEPALADALEEHTGPADATAPPLRALQVLDHEPVMSPSMMALLCEAAEEVLCPVGLALVAALPAGSAPRVVNHFEITPRGREALRSGAARGPTREVLVVLEHAPARAPEVSRTVQSAGALLEALCADGLARRGDALRGPAARTARDRFARLAEGVDVEAACAGPLARASKQAALLRALAEGGERPTRVLLEQVGTGSATLRALVERGLAETRQREVPRNVLGPPVERDVPLALTDEQARALSAIQAGIEAREARVWLLHGVTGSGKTEVYLRAVQAALERGRQALVLVPEITLTHQILARLRARFGDTLAVLHSGLRPGERLEQWQRLREGKTPIAVGARSALFAPLDDLGVIIIDEEHDGAYKNEEGFRYHARRLAERRAAHAGCPLVLGSATPSLETRYRAETGEIERLVLPRRIGGRPLPRVEIVDLEAERRHAARGRKLILSRPLRRALIQTLEGGGQSILFLNRRGFSTQIFCFDCGFAERCGSCDVALVYHAADHCLRCHYCDFQKPPPEQCGGCGRPDTALLGTGTERLEEEVRSLLPAARLARLDRDTARRRGHVESVLTGLRAGEIDVLIGTQMVAKGHDFPGVRLVGVVAADLGLHMPDFRAAERCFQLLTQVAGRAGRAAIPGRVVLQTFVPDHYAIRPVREHDYESFYAEETRYRDALHFPPFGRITQVTVSGENDETTRKAAEALATAARAQLPGGGQPGRCEVMGPAPAALPRLRDRYRHQLLVKGRDADLVRACSRHISRAARRLPRGIGAVVDVDPINML
ncbi:MAG: primosomal protein N' [Deltaproteobacteria bacterium]|nr:primosomal protein N' [Deltaproteobacteria bacterium]